ncbi:DUF4440 domain-containing protein [Polaribacter filamentus]|uniref:DUF4440 domain-containing protein n=1 Tax=Polaribacter filamentus TaxID=53483 RepID=A0A2S7KZ43_9FLAO|nr:nuclear transport factor 2 family protein [Polaribacter filamentus]PQB07942.1 DUF4440 domain-containing protein [Polaribacter filamentus]
MKKLMFLFAAILVLSSCKIETKEQDKKDILAIMDAQQIAWSKHDLEGFMQGYWKSDSLKFYGSNGVKLGWDKTLANYKKRYPTPDHSGILEFKINDITKIEKESYYVMGAYHLTRKVGDASGVFMIIFRKIKGEWKIVADTSC